MSPVDSLVCKGKVISFAYFAYAFGKSEISNPRSLYAVNNGKGL